MRQLQDLILELNQEIAAVSDEAAADNPRIAELRGRIAELAREDVVGSSTSRSGGSRSAPSEAGNAPPPAYHG